MDKTVFRIYPDGEVIALFPQISASVTGDLCESYMHVGQHGGASPVLVVEQTRLAKPKEYRKLLKEIKQLGYKPKLGKRCTYKDFLIRHNQYNR